jgi:flagellar biosynthetic protein FliS
MYQNPKEVYLKNWVENASPVEIVIALYKKMEELLNEIIKLYNEEGKCTNPSQESYLNKRVEEILLYLNSTINYRDGKDVAKTLNQFYLICLRQLDQAIAKQDVNLYKDLKEAIAEMRDAWEQVLQKTRPGANAEDRPSE